MSTLEEQLDSLRMQLTTAIQERDQAREQLSTLQAAENEYWSDLVFRIPHSTLSETLDDYDETRIEVENLKARLAGNMKGQGHLSDKLQQLRQAAEHFWANAAPDDPATHPKNPRVAAHLQQLGWSQNMAETGASIIRPGWAHRGRPEMETP